MCASCISVRVEIDWNLRVKMLAGVEMGRFEIRAQAVDELRAKGHLLLQQQMAIVALYARIGLEPFLRRADWRLTRMHSSPGVRCFIYRAARLG